MAERYTVSYAPAASADLLDIASYIAERRGIEAGDAFLDSMVERVARLERFPFRGSTPKELADHDEADVRQLVAGKMRIIYAVLDDEVIVLLIADGRRDMAALLRERVLGGDPTA